MSYKLEPAIWSRGTGQRITWFDRCQFTITWCHMSKKYKKNQGCMSLSTYYLEYGHHLARLHCRRRRRCAYVPTSNTASDDNHEKINSWVSFSFLYGYGAPLGGPLGSGSSAIISSGEARIYEKFPAYLVPGVVWIKWICALSVCRNRAFILASSLAIHACTNDSLINRLTITSNTVRIKI